MSSAYCIIFTFPGRKFSSSLVNRTYISGDKIVPWGKPRFGDCGPKIPSFVDK